MSTYQRESTEKLTGVAETLLITLYARYLETQRPDSFFQDLKAVEVLNKIDYDFNRYAKGWKSNLGVIVRLQEFDQIIRELLTDKPNTTVINLGCGLCTRFDRIDNGSVRWYEIDLPDVIELRRKFFEENERYQFIGKSVLDFSWIDQIQQLPNQHLVIVMEGVSCYLSEADNRALMSQICTRLSPTEFIFDVISRRISKNSANHDTVSKTDAEFKSGIDNSKDLENWEPGITLKSEHCYLTRIAAYTARLPLWARYIAPILIPLFKQGGRILHLQIHKNA